MQFRLRFTGMAIVFAIALLPITASADLLGSQVTGTLYFPDLSTVFSGPQGPVSVTNAVEFPSLAFDGTLDVTGNQVIWTATLDEHYSPGQFNGFQLVFSGAPTITGVTVDAASTLTVVSYSFTGNTILLNVADDVAVAGQTAILDVTTSTTTTPEPATLMLLSIGLGGLAGLRCKLKL